ncbi:MAG: hypothetical protein EP330_17700 [Deltaproteobacteria bacterium]|nr:MAG: hypothetical protein EP330_17700 [Deltaproteobacteria bacterium]
MSRLTPFLALLVACNGLGGGSDEDTGYAPPVELATPDLTGVDLDTLWTEAFRTVLAVDARAAWSAHKDALGLVTPGCPDLYYGVPPVEDDGLPDMADGMAWADHCTTAGDRTFAGHTFWQNAASTLGSTAAPEGLTTTGTRSLFTDGIVSEGDTVVSELDGEIRDSLLRIQTESGDEWTYNSLVDATVTGTAAASHGMPAGGLRADLVLSYRGGDVRTLEDARGNVFFFEHRIGDRFDSIAIDLTHAAPSNNANDCPDEPLGYISVRDENAFWYDLVFQPRYGAGDEGYENLPYTECDGCGNIYVRGLDQGIEVCPDLSFLWDGSTLNAPVVEDYLLSTRDFPQGGN